MSTATQNRLSGRHITPEMTVHDINLLYPACREVFARHGLGLEYGELGPEEPLEFFAEAHRVNYQKLLAELEAAASRPVADLLGETLRFERRLTRLFKAYLSTAIAITLSVGTVWGVKILLEIAFHRSFRAPDYAGIQAHGHAQIYGWVGLFIMGVAYFSVPKFLQARPRSLVPGWTAFALMTLGIALRAIAQPLAQYPEFGDHVLVSAIFELAGISIFATDLALVFARSRQRGQHFLGFVYAALAAFVSLAAWNLALVVPLWQGVSRVIGEPANSRFLFLALFGFITNMIFGYSLRLLPTLLGLRPTRRGLVLPALVVFNAGVVAELAGRDLVAGILVFWGALLFITALRIFEPPSGQPKLRGVDVSFPWFIRLAYAWLVISAGMVLSGSVYAAIAGAPPHIYVGAWRHAVTVGFITTLMVGVAYRLVPMFLGVDLWRPALMRATFWLLAVGNAMRVIFQLGTATESGWAFSLMGVSGVLELSGLALFGAGLWRTFTRRPLILVTPGQISAETNVRWLLDNFPEVREGLVSGGLKYLQNLPTIPSFVTLEQVARMHGLDVEPFVQHLREVLKPQMTGEHPETRDEHSAGLTKK